MPDLTIQDIEKIASLARLSLSDKEKAVYAEQLSVVFGYVDMLNEVSTDGVNETCQVTGLTDVVRDDVAVPSDAVIREKMIEQFPVKQGSFLKVKAVFE